MEMKKVNKRCYICNDELYLRWKVFAPNMYYCYPCGQRLIKEIIKVESQLAHKIIVNESLKKINHET